MKIPLPMYAFSLEDVQRCFQNENGPDNRKMSSILCIHNDLCICGQSKKEYDVNLLQFMQVAGISGPIFHSRRWQIKFLQITFYGTTFSKEGMKPDSQKIQGITEMPPRCTVTTVTSRFAKFHTTMHYTHHSTTQGIVKEN